MFGGRLLMDNYKCDLCKMENLPGSHWTTYLHLQNQLLVDQQKLNELNEDK